MFAVTVNFRLAPDHVESFMQAMRLQARQSVEREPGCLQFDVCVHPSDPTRVFLYEIYTSAEAFDVHLDSEHFHSFSGTVRDWVTDKQVGTWSIKEHVI